MKEIDDIKQIQDMELEILIEFDNFCEKHELIYSLMGGTMLGAIRHNGFIPWDDDIDVSMPRPDYEKFIELTKNGLRKDLEVFSINTHENYIHYFAKIVDTRTILYEKNVRDKYKIGLNIDVFPVDGYPEDEKVAKEHYKKIARLKKFGIWSARIERKDGPVKSMLKSVRNYPFSLVGPSYFARRRDEEYKKFDFVESNDVTYSTGYADRTKMTKEQFLNLIDVEFCGYKFKCQKDYDYILRCIYGDYMTLPPLEKRVSHHNIKVFWK